MKAKAIYDILVAVSAAERRLILTQLPKRVLSIFVLIILLTFAPALLSGGFFKAPYSRATDYAMEQSSVTEDGQLSRYISISSPWSGGYLFEDMTVIGSASVTESFTMNNLGPGSEADRWKKAYEDFGIGFDINPDIFPKAASPGSPVLGSGAGSKPAAAVAGAKVEVEAESESNIRKGFRWLDLF